MNVFKITFPSIDTSDDLREAIYLLQDGDAVTFIYETVYDGPCSGDGKGWEEATKPNFRVLKPEEVEADPDLLSFLGAVSRGEQDSHPRSLTRFDLKPSPRRSRN